MRTATVLTSWGNPKAPFSETTAQNINVAVHNMLKAQVPGYREAADRHAARGLQPAYSYLLKKGSTIALFVDHRIYGLNQPNINVEEIDLDDGWQVKLNGQWITPNENLP